MKKTSNSIPIPWSRLIGLLLILWSFPGSNCQGQEPCIKISHLPVDSLDLPKVFDQIQVDIQGNIYLLSHQQKGLYKYLANTGYDSLLNIGGASSLNSAVLLAPHEMQVSNYQQLYILDEGTQSILIFDKDLSRLRSLDFRTSFEVSGNAAGGQNIQVLSMAVNTVNEVYLLNSWDHKIYHFDLQGNLLQTFGGMDYGPGTLKSPSVLHITGNNDIFVQESTPLGLMQFDAFGTYQSHIDLRTFGKAPQLRIWYPYVLVWDASHLHLARIHPVFEQECSLKIASPPLDAALSKNYLYLLFKDAVKIFPISL